LNYDAPIDSSRDSIRSDVTPANSSSSQDYNPSAFDTRPSADRQTFESVEDMRPDRRAANDDRETIGQILQAIQKAGPPATSIRSPRFSPRFWVLGAGLLTVAFLLRCRLPSDRAAVRWCWPAWRRCSLRRVAVLFPGEPFLARPGVADDRAVDGGRLRSVFRSPRARQATRW